MEDDNISVKARKSSDEYDEEDNTNGLFKNNLLFPWRSSEILFQKKYIINFSQRLASNVFKERNLETDEQLVFKFEKVNHSHLITETIILFDLNKIERISKIISVGIEGSYKILVMKYIGPSLKYYFRRCNRKFTLPTTLKISIQVLNILQQIHDKGIVLRYLKPENMLIGSGRIRIMCI